MLVLLLACSSSAEEAASAPAPTLDGQPVVLADWMGAPPLSAAKPGDYALELSASSTAFITMERNIWEGVKGRLSLSVVQGGAFTGCLQFERTSGGSVSKYASHDGEYHHNEYTDEQQISFKGSWAMEGEWMALTLEGSAWNTCEPDAEHHPVTGSLRCLTMGPGGVLPVASLGCVVADNSAVSLATMALPLGVPDPTPRPPDIHPPAQKWLLVGSPGLEVDWSYRDGSSAVPMLRMEPLAP